MINSILTTTTAAFDGFTRPAAIADSDDYALFAFVRPNATGGQQVHVSFVTAPILASGDAWIKTQFTPTINPDGTFSKTPKYTDISDLILQNIVSGLMTTILAQFPPSTLISSIQKVQQEMGALKSAQVGLLESVKAQ